MPIMLNDCYSMTVDVCICGYEAYSMRKQPKKKAFIQDCWIQPEHAPTPKGTPFIGYCIKMMKE